MEHSDASDSPASSPSRWLPPVSKDALRRPGSSATFGDGWFCFKMRGASVGAALPGGRTGRASTLRSSIFFWRRRTWDSARSCGNSGELVRMESATTAVFHLFSVKVVEHSEYLMLRVEILCTCWPRPLPELADWAPSTFLAIISQTASCRCFARIRLADCRRKFSPSN